ncbi:hypothetical protein FOL47_011268, partial [Perkinsus chesapeaki]
MAFGIPMDPGNPGWRDLGTTETSTTGCNKISELVTTHRLRRDRFTEGSGISGGHTSLRASPKTDTSPDAIERLLQQFAGARKLMSVSAGTLRTYTCGTRNYIKFCSVINQESFPPDPQTVSIWLMTFRRATTAKNYLTGLRFFAKILCPNHGAGPILDTEAIKDSLHVLKMVSPPPEKKLGIRMAMILKILRRLDNLWEIARTGSRYEITAATEEGRFAVGALVAYTCALRVGSELLVLSWNQISFNPQANSFTIHLPHRKNIRHPVTVERPCVCSAEPALCAYHRLLFLKQLLPEWGKGQSNSGTSCGKWFPYTLGCFNTKLRKTLEAIGVSEVSKYASHSFRRGSTQDITSGGGKASLTQVLRHQQVASASYRQYLDTREAEKLEFEQLVTAMCAQQRR